MSNRIARKALIVPRNADGASAVAEQRVQVIVRAVSNEKLTCVNAGLDGCPRFAPTCVTKSKHSYDEAYETEDRNARLRNRWRHTVSLATAAG